MKRILSLLLAVLLSASLIPASAFAEGGRVFCVSADGVGATALSAGDEFTVKYLINNACMLANCRVRIHYPAEYVTPVAYEPTVTQWNPFFNVGVRFGDGEDGNWGVNTCECVLEAGEGGEAYSLVDAYVDHDWYVFYGGNLFELIDITYRIDAVPPTGALPVDETGAYAELLPEVEYAYYYTDLNDSQNYDTQPYDDTECGPVRVYMPLAPVPQPVAVAYTGESVWAADNAVGESLYWTLGISAHSYLWSGRWLVDYPEEYLEPRAYSVTWSGGITAAVQASADEGTQTSDIPAVVANIAYEGQTGGSPQGEAGNMYSLVGMYLTSFDFNGLQAEGSIIRIEYGLIARPERESCLEDGAGSYIELPVSVIESTYWIPGVTEISPYNTDHLAQHNVVEVTNGRVYLYGPAAVTHTVAFIGMNGELIAEVEVEDGMAAEAPEAPSPVELNGLRYYFMGWDGDFDCVTEDMTVTAVYRMVGDIDGDGELTFTDISTLYSYALGTNDIELPLVIGDVNSDGEISFADIGALYALIIG